MDTGLDFIQPEFLNILFFQQKSLIIFPYIDLKHLHSLEIFTTGFNIVDLESTALFNLKEIIEFENNSYSQTPSLFFIYNISRDKIKEILEIKNIRCIINTNERVEDLAENKDFVFYNKKNKKFLNFNNKDNNLEFEKYLIKSSENLPILQDKIQKIKAVSTRIFTEINQEGNVEKIQKILSEFDPKYWYKILINCCNYYQVKIPNEADILKTNLKGNKIIQERQHSKIIDFSDEYDLIITLNKNIAKEFIQLLHEYRSNRVNPSNLDLEQLYNPQKLYSYLRNHHWKTGISEDFLFKWIRMEISGYSLTTEDYNDFEEIFKVLNIPDDLISNSLNVALQQEDIEFAKEKKSVSSEIKEKFEDHMPLIKNFSQFKKWLLDKMDEIERIIE